MSNGLRTGDESLKKTPIAQLEYLGVPTRVINLVEEGMGTLWIEELPTGHELREKLEMIRMVGPCSLKLLIEGIKKIRKGGDSR